MCYTVEVGVVHVNMCLWCDMLHCRGWCVTCKDRYVCGVMCYTVEVGVVHVNMCLCCDVLHCRGWCSTCKYVFVL